MADTRTIRFDPHVHTGASYDAEGSVHEVLNYCQNTQLDAVAITDHDTTVAAREAIQQQARYEVTVVPGAEVSTADGHLLALNVVDRPPVGQPFTETVDWIRDAGGIAVVPHPFQRSRHGIPKRAIDSCDGIEVFNAWSMIGIQNQRAASFADDRGYPALGGSDAHRSGMIGQAYTEIEVAAPPSELTADDIIAAIDAGETRAVGEPISKRRYLRKYVRAVRYRLANRAP